MKQREVIIGIIVVLLVAGVVYLRQRSRPKEEMQVPQTLSVEEELEQKFNLQIPEDVDKAELKDVSGGNTSGIATRKFENNRFTHTVLADLPNPDQGTFYEGWLVKGEVGQENFTLISTGRIKLAKGGWTLDFNSTINYSDHNNVVITLEKVADKTPEKHILEGSF